MKGKVYSSLNAAMAAQGVTRPTAVCAAFALVVKNQKRRAGFFCQPAEVFHNLAHLGAILFDRAGDEAQVIDDDHPRPQAINFIVENPHTLHVGGYQRRRRHGYVVKRRIIGQLHSLRHSVNALIGAARAVIHVNPDDRRLNDGRALIATEQARQPRQAAGHA